MAFTNFETLFLEVSVTIWHLSTRERVRKKKKTWVQFKKKKVKCDSQYKLWIVLENFQATNFNQNLNALWLSCLHLVRKQFFLKKPRFFPFQGRLSSGKNYNYNIFLWGPILFIFRFNTSTEVCIGNSEI